MTKSSLLQAYLRCSMMQTRVIHVLNINKKNILRVEHFFLCVLSNAGFAAIFLNFAGNTKNQIFFSPCGNMMLLMMGFEKIFLWQKSEKDDPGNLP